MLVDVGPDRSDELADVAEDASTQPFIGRTLTIRAHARHPLPDTVFPFLATGTANIPLPALGTLRLDPASLVPLPPFVVPALAGEASIGIPVPPAPSLVGAPVHLQAVTLWGPVPPSLGNVTSDRVDR